MRRKKHYFTGFFIIAVSIGFVLSACENASDRTKPIAQLMPVVDDFDISGLVQTYDGSPKPVSITAKQGGSNGNITIYYAGSGSTVYEKKTQAPSAAGAYTVTFDVAPSKGFKAALGLSAGILSINMIPEASDFNFGNLTQAEGSVTAVLITPKEGKSGGGITVFYEGTGSTVYAKSTEVPTAIGTYAVSFDVDAAYGFSAAVGLDGGILRISAVSQTITITAQPAAITNVIQGSISGSLSLEANVTGFVELSYQWFSNTINSNYGGNLLGVSDNAEFAIPQMLMQGTYYFYCVVSAEGAAPVCSETATVIVAPFGSKPIPDAGCFTVSNNSKIYNGAPQDATVSYTGYISIFEAGEITAHYSGKDETVYAESTTAPTNVGTYEVKVTTEGGSVYAKLSTPILAGVLTITVKEINITGVSATNRAYDGSTTVSLTGGQLAGLAYGDAVNFDIGEGAIEDANVGSNKIVTTNIILTGADAENYSLMQPDNIRVTISKAAGAVVDTPELNNATHNSITVHSAAETETGQSIEYGISASNNANNAAWQSELIFSGCNIGSLYYIFARAAENENYSTGTASSALLVTTQQTVSPDRFEYYWVNEHGSLVTTSGGIVTVAAGVNLTITAQSAGYVVKQWHLNGVNTGQSGNTFIFSSIVAGQHTIGLFVEKDGKLYNTNIVVVVNSVIFTENFEGTSSFTLVNGSQTNQWRVGTATSYSGSRSAYISNNSGTSNAYTITSTSTVHMYRDVAFPTSSVPYTLSFYWKCQGESSYDYLRIFLVNTTVTPTAGSTTSLGTAL